MRRVTGPQLKQHEMAMALIMSDKPLSTEKRAVALANYRPEADKQFILKGASFFTPESVAYATATLGADTGTTVDLCAGIGFCAAQVKGRGQGPDYDGITAVEYNPRYLEIGKRILPEVNWGCGSIFDETIWHDLGTFDQAISNPPYGKATASVKGESGWLLTQGSTMELMAVEVAMRVAHSNILLILQESVPSDNLYSYGARRGNPNGARLQKFLDALEESLLVSIL